MNSKPGLVQMIYQQAIIGLGLGLQIKSNQVYCHILQEEVYMSLAIYPLWQQHIKQ